MSILLSLKRKYTQYMNDFKTLWHAAREKKNSNIIAGLDPAEFALGRGESGLSEGVDTREWALAYVEAVSPYVAGVKPNLGYFQRADLLDLLKEIGEIVHAKGLVYIADAKISDIGSTNDAWAHYIRELGFDAVTFAPYAGNLEDSIKSAHDRSIAAITMGLMSNPQYATEMNFKNEEGTSLWLSRVKRSIEAGADGIVAGGTFTKDSKEFMEFVDVTNDSDILYLIPGIGKQGGGVKDFLATGIDADRCMVNSGRGLMFPNGAESTNEDQAKAAKELQEEFNMNK